jgi:hypothetical protein
VKAVSQFLFASDGFWRVERSDFRKLRGFMAIWKAFDEILLISSESRWLSTLKFQSRDKPGDDSRNGVTV